MECLSHRSQSCHRAMEAHQDLIALSPIYLKLYPLQDTGQYVLYLYYIYRKDLHNHTALCHQLFTLLPPSLQLNLLSCDRSILLTHRISTGEQPLLLLVHPLLSDTLKTLKITKALGVCLLTEMTVYYKLC